MRGWKGHAVTLPDRPRRDDTAASVVHRVSDRCSYCGCRLIAPERAAAWQWGAVRTVDHVTPKSRGGANSLDNMLPACARCNNRKGAMTLPEYRRHMQRFTGCSMFYIDRHPEIMSMLRESQVQYASPLYLGRRPR